MFILFLALLNSASALKFSKLPECPEVGNKFPDDFIFGAASASYQIEGAWNVDGKGPSIWDIGTQNTGQIVDNSTGDVACDSYHKFEEDIKALKATGFTTYRFSISWPRIMPKGRKHLNQAGINYYHRLIDDLLVNGVEPFVTMYHWDLPQALQDLGGFMNPMIADWFGDYADVLFREYGHKVKHWSTFNEPNSICDGGYSEGHFAPFLTEGSTGGDYLCAYNLLLAHARAYHVYEKYRPTQEGKIGIVLHYMSYYPIDETDVAERSLEFYSGLYAHPIYKNGWPLNVETRVNNNSRLEGRPFSRLPEMPQAVKEYIHGTSDYFGLNYYTTFLVQNDPDVSAKEGIAKDKAMLRTKHQDWETAESNWLHHVPEGFRDVMNYVDKTYNHPEIWVTENGWSDVGQLKDEGRVRYYREHLAEVLKALKCDGVNVTRYYAWSLVDNFEWTSGYTQKFGLYHVNFSDPERPRTAKDSARFFAGVTRTKEI